MKRLLYIVTAALLIALAMQGRTRTTQANLHTNAVVMENIVPDADDSVALAVDQSAITLRGYSKRASDSKETFFVTNNTQYRLSAIRLTMRYTGMDGMMLHEREVTVPVAIGPGETQMAAIRTWDPQHNFYYYGSSRPRKAATPYQVAYRLTGYDITIGH